jgi:hypothetical protein
MPAMSEQEHEAPADTTARDLAIEALLTEKALWGLLGCVVLIVITMCTSVEANIPWYPVTLDIQGFLGLAGLSVTTILLRNKAMYGGSHVVTLTAAVVLCSLPLLVGLYSALYVGAYGLMQAALGMHWFDAVMRVFFTFAGLFIMRDSVRLILAVRTFSPDSALLAAMENEAAIQPEACSAER